MDYYDLIDKDKDREQFDDLYSKEFGVAQDNTPNQATYAEPEKEKKKSKKSFLLCGCIVLLISIIVITSGVFIIFMGDEAKTIVEDLTSTNNEEEIQNEKPEEVVQIEIRDLPDQDLEKLGVIAIPENSEVEEVYKGIQLISSPERKLSEEEVSQIKYYLDDLPSKLTNPGPRAIVSVKKSELGNMTLTNPLIVAWASGPYIFVTDQTFEGNFLQRGVSFDDVENTIAHEFVHVLQFYSVSEDRINEILEGGKGGLDLNMDSEDVIAYAEEVGWEAVYGSQDEILSWELKDEEESQQTTDYGTTAPAEDHAESMSHIAMGECEIFSEERLDWAEEYFELSIEDLAIGRLPIYPDSQRVKIIMGEGYDEDVFDQYKDLFFFADAQNYDVEEVDQVDTVGEYFREEFEVREWKEEEWKRSKDAKGVVTYHGIFTYKLRQVDLEIVSYDSAKGYVVKPEGTLISVISGVNF